MWDTNAIWHITLPYIVRAVLKGTKAIFLQWKMLETNNRLMKMGGESMDIYGRWGSLLFLVNIPCHPLTPGDKSLECIQKLHIYIHLCADSSTSAHTKHPHLPTYVSVFVFVSMYVCTLVGKGCCRTCLQVPYAYKYYGKVLRLLFFFLFPLSEWGLEWRQNQQNGLKQN